MNKPYSPCLHCKDRYVGCHSACSKWDDYEEAKAEWNDMIKEAKRQFRGISDQWSQSQKRKWLKRRYKK